MKFELLGADRDETRLFVLPDIGYSVPLPGNPVLVDGDTATVRLRDVNAEYTFRVEEVPLTTDHQAAAVDAVIRVAAERKRNEWKVTPSQVTKTLRPATATGGAHATYPLRAGEGLVAEHLWVCVKPVGNALHVLSRATRYRPDEFSTIKWSHLRTASGAHHHWDPAAPRTTTPTIWPESTLARPGVKLELTDATWEEAHAKLGEIRAVTLDEARALVEVLNHAAEGEFPPHVVLPQILVDLYPMRLHEQGAPGTILARGVERCSTAFDFRAWAAQGAWVLGNCATR